MKVLVLIGVVLVFLGSPLSTAQARGLAFPIEGWGVLSAFFFGFVGSTHCLGMCGPLVTLYSRTLPPRGAYRQHLLYNLGRVLVYTDLGIILGFLGRGLALRPWMSLIVGGIGGAFVIAMGFYFLRLGTAALWVDHLLAAPTAKLARVWRALHGVTGSRGIIVLGALHGLLPCPLLYVMFSSAIALQSPLHAGILLSSFGLGTVPVMWSIGVVANRLPLATRDWLQRVFGGLIILWGLVLCFHALGFE